MQEFIDLLKKDVPKAKKGGVINLAHLLTFFTAVVSQEDLVQGLTHFDDKFCGSAYYTLGLNSLIGEGF